MERFRKEQGAHRARLLDGWCGFAAAVRWTEPLVLGLLAAQLALLAAAVLTRKRWNVQTGIFVAALGMVYAAERINALGAAHWRKFATQNYFDKRGVFMSALWSAPLMLTACAVMVLAVVTSADLLVQVKRAQLKRATGAPKKDH